MKESVDDAMVKSLTPLSYRHCNPDSNVVMNPN